MPLPHLRDGVLSFILPVYKSHTPNTELQTYFQNRFPSSNLHKRFYNFA